MKLHPKPVALLLAGSLLLAGCASSRASTRGPADPPSGNAMTPGMIMPDGSTMGASGASSGPDGPSAAARMICAAEVRTDLETVLGLPMTPMGKPSWADHLYTCTYTLPMGKLILSVKQAADPAGTTSYYAGLRQRLGHAQDLAGLGEAAYGTTDGAVVLRKDNDVLHVDATRLPAEFGAQHQKRTDFAYEIASDILGCWTGD